MEGQPKAVASSPLNLRILTSRAGPRNALKGYLRCLHGSPQYCSNILLSVNLKRTKLSSYGCIQLMVSLGRSFGRALQKKKAAQQQGLNAQHMGADEAHNARYTRNTGCTDYPHSPAETPPYTKPATSSLTDSTYLCVRLMSHAECYPIPAPLPLHDLRTHPPACNPFCHTLAGRSRYKKHILIPVQRPRSSCTTKK